MEPTGRRRGRRLRWPIVLALALAGTTARAQPAPPGGDPYDPSDPYGEEQPPRPLPTPPPASVPTPLPPLAPPPPLPVSPGWRASDATYSATWEDMEAGRERRRARIQVAVGLGAWGLYTGPATAWLVCDGGGGACEAAMGLAAVVGPAAGVGLGFLLSSPARYREGAALATVAGAWWGFWNAVAFSSTRRDVHDRVVVRDSLLGSSAGIAAGALVGLLRPTTAQVALGNSFAAYAGLATALLTVMGRPRHESDYGRNAIIAADGGLLVGYLVATKLEMTRRRAALLDAGAAAGAAIGSLASLAFMGKADHLTPDQERLIAGMTAAGMTAGVVVAWVMTRHLTARSAGPRLAGFPALLALDEEGWALGAPAPRPVVGQAADGRRGVGAAVDVVGGRF